VAEVLPTTIYAHFQYFVLKRNTLNARVQTYLEIRITRKLSASSRTSAGENDDALVKTLGAEALIKKAYSLVIRTGKTRTYYYIITR